MRNDQTTKTETATFTLSELRRIIAQWRGSSLAERQSKMTAADAYTGIMQALNDAARAKEARNGN